MYGLNEDVVDNDLKLFDKFNDTNHEFRDDVTIQELFEEIVELKGNAPAVFCDHGKSFNGKNSMSYSELNDWSNRLAVLLRDNGIAGDKVVGIYAERSFALIIGIFGILKAGGAYLPLSPDYPQERISYMLSDSSVEVLLVQDKTAGKISFDGIVINIEDTDIYPETIGNVAVRNSPRNLAYVIYTSGSTGRPKGVMIEHRSLVNRLMWMQRTYPLNENDVILQKTPFYFDVSVWEIFWWAITGAKMCLLLPGGEKMPLAIIETIKKNNISVLHFVPSMLNVFIEYLESKEEAQVKKLSSIRIVFSSGEALTVSHVKKFNSVFYKQTGAELVNLYGPTEATVDVSYYNCPTDDNIEKIPIGKPIDNIKFFIIKNNELLPAGEAGELCISGVGLARGYINNPDLTEEKFADNPFSPGNKMYKTGDIARWLPDGNVEYLGREDFQVKIRGLRIELGEIESAIREYSGVSDTIVLIKKYSESIIIIIAYIAPKQDYNAEDLKRHLRKILPEYMIPGKFILIEELPLLPNGKADRKALPDPQLNII